MFARWSREPWRRILAADPDGGKQREREKERKREREREEKSRSVQTIVEGFILEVDRVEC